MAISVCNLPHRVKYDRGIQSEYPFLSNLLSDRINILPHTGHKYRLTSCIYLHQSEKRMKAKRLCECLAIFTGIRAIPAQTRDIIRYFDRHTYNVSQFSPKFRRYYTFHYPDFYSHPVLLALRPRRFESGKLRVSTYLLLIEDIFLKIELERRRIAPLCVGTRVKYSSAAVSSESEM